MDENKTDQSGSFFLKGESNTGFLLLHGWCSFADEFLPLAEYLNSFGYTVSAPLLRGHGTKPEDLDGVCWEDWLEDARKNLRELEKAASKIFICGISMGGDLALHLSEEKSVAGVILLGSAVRYKLHPLVKIALFFMGLTKKYRRKYYPPWVRRKMGSRKVYTYYPIESAKEAVRLAEAAREILPRITKPILITQSTTDHLISKKSPRMIYEDVKSKVKEIFWIEDVYHVFVRERKVWEKIREFISRI